MSIKDDDLLIVHHDKTAYKIKYSKIKSDIREGADAVGEAPNDGKQYARQSEAWSEVAASGVSSIIAGDGISVDQATGDVTITSTGTVDPTPIYGTAKLRFILDCSTISIIQGSGATASKNGTGIYVITFDTPRTSNYYVALGSGNSNTNTRNKTLNGFDLVTRSSGGSASNVDTEIDITIFDDQPEEGVAVPPKGPGNDGWAIVDETSVNGPANVLGSFNVASITRTSKGFYDVVFNTPMPTANYAVTVTADYGVGAAEDRVASYSYRTPTGFSISVKQASTGADQDNGFSFTVNATNASLPSTLTQDEVDLIFDTIKGNGVAQNVALLADVKPNGSDGGDAIVGWQDRTLNTILSDVGNLVTLANDKEFTLKPGTYLIAWRAPAYEVSRHQTRLTNVTSGTVEGLGTSLLASASNNSFNISSGEARVNILSDTTYKIEHYITNRKNGSGLGLSATNSGENGVFAQVTITDLNVRGGSDSTLAATLMEALTRIQSLEATIQTLQADHTTLMNNNGGSY